MKPLKTLILASSSRYRQQQLRQFDLPFHCQSPNIDETILTNESTQALVERLSYQKAQAIQNEHPNSIIIGSDQSAELDGIQLSKPITKTNAIKQLSVCSGRTVRFYTGICVLAPNKQEHTGSVITEVVFRDLCASQIRTYIDKESPLDCAGSFKCEGLGITLFKAINSNDPSALIGLPLITLNDYLLKVGVDAINGGL